MIELTAAATQKIKHFLEAEPGKCFRIKLKIGGCNGVSVSSQVDDDVSYRFDDLILVIDPLSDSLLPSLRIDYLDSLTFSGFKFDNPSAISKCGCGQSFSL